MSNFLPQPWLARLDEARNQRLRLGRVRTLTGPKGLDFSSNDYLGLRRDPRLAQAAFQAMETYGFGSGGARLLRGDSPPHNLLEAALANWKGAPSALLFNTGFQCNATVIPALLRPGDAVFSDSLNHASLVDGCRMAVARGAHLGIFRHLDLADLDRQLAAWRAQASGEALALVITDAVFSVDGDVADLPGLLTLCEAHQALLMVDEAHATGLLGPTGAGLAEAQGLKGRIPLLMGTLGKALGSFGAFIACDEAMRDHLVNTCRGFIFSTSLPPPVAAASLEAITIAQAEPWRRARALGHADRLRTSLGLSAQPSAIVPVIIGEDAAATEQATRLQTMGFDVRAVRPPTVPEGSARLRITTGAHLTEQEVDALIDALCHRPPA